jgi:hypothetical protein
VIAGEIDAPSPDSFFLSALATLAAARSLESGQAEAIVQVQEFSAEPSTEAEVGRPK